MAAAGLGQIVDSAEGFYGLQALRRVSEVDCSVYRDCKQIALNKHPKSKCTLKSSLQLPNMYCK